jgi:hypothetical protein
VLLTSTGGPARLLRNDQTLEHHWVRLKLVGTKSNRDAIGALVELHSGKTVQRRQVMPTRSYLSQSELPVTFGLGNVSTIDKVVIRWPDGSSQERTDVPIDRLTVIEQAK